MKTPGIIASTFIILLVFFVSGQQNIDTVSEINISPDSVFTEMVPEPLDIQEIVHEYDSLISAQLELTRTVGAAIAVVYKNQVVLLKCFGVRNARTKDSINENTIFRLASVSKPISGVLAGKLAEEKIIGLDDKVTDYIPELRLKNQKSTNELTIKNLLSHTTGLVPHAYDDLVEQKVSLSVIMNRLYLANTAASPGNLYTYQNVMFSLLDPIVESKTGKNYGEVLKEKIFVPFGMNDASTGFESFESAENKAIPHSGRTPIKLNDRYYSTAPAAGVNASISDMKNFLLTLLKDSSEAISDHAEDV
ncbi:MAG TPA: serine hydrolase domain-containing protein, partial [Draconibacterium sp.]|nr:serine hydrolase domain-containing protein [Draconibacterium sp.]